MLFENPGFLRRFSQRRASIKLTQTYLAEIQLQPFRCRQGIAGKLTGRLGVDSPACHPGHPRARVSKATATLALLTSRRECFRVGLDFMRLSY